MASFLVISCTLRIIATTAFGMGGRYSRYSANIYWGLPATLEEFVKEAGRLGRGGRHSVAIAYASQESIIACEGV